jgi:hypothetical protein
MDSDGGYYRLDYLSTYPSTPSNYYISRTYPEDLCTTDNMNYLTYFEMPLSDFWFPLDECLTSFSTSDFYSTELCSSTGQLLVNSYTDNNCMNLDISTPMWGNNCISDDDDDWDDDDDDDDDGSGDDDDDDDDDDDRDDDDDYNVVGVITDDFCT